MNASVQWRRFRVTGLFAPLILLITVGISSCKPSKQTTIAFDPQPPDPTEVARVLEQDAKAISGYTPGRASQDVIQAFVALNSLADVRAQSVSEEKIEQTFADLRRAIARCLDEEGRENVHRLGLYLLARFERSLDDLVTETRSAGLTAAKLLIRANATPAVEPVLKKFIEIGGDFLPLAVDNNLIRDDPKGGIQVAPDTAFFVRLAFKVYWANILPEPITPLALMLTNFEREQYDRWVLERSKTAPLARRMQAIDNLKARDPSFPDFKARGIVLYQAGSYPAAAQAFEEALKQNTGDRTLKSFLKQARRNR
jgi:tetratricopeptide (TPR) repeat protein